MKSRKLKICLKNLHVIRLENLKEINEFNQYIKNPRQIKMQLTVYTDLQQLVFSSN